MNDDSIPLYVGIPLVMLCVAASIFAVVMAVTIWRERK